MHDLQVIRRAHLALAARHHADDLLSLAEKCAGLLDTDSPIGNDARVLVERIYGEVRQAAEAPVNTGPHTYIPSPRYAAVSDRAEDGVRLLENPVD